jgi:apolipoprotein N-acyltransferase
VTRSDAGLAVGASVSAICVVASSPGGPLPWLMPLALVPYFLQAGRASSLARAAASFFVAGMWSVPIASALFFRAPGVGVLLAAVPATLLATCLFAAASVPLHGWKQLLSFGALWASSAEILRCCSAELPGWALSAGIALAFPASWPVIALGGWPLLDLLLLSLAALAWGGATGRMSPRALVVAVGAALVVAWLSSYANDRVSAHGTLRVGVVQGDIPWTTLRTVGISPRSRAVVRERILRLTRRAIEMRADVVVWPENGTGTPVGQIRADATVIAEASRRTGSVIVAPGDELGPEGSHAVAWIFDGDELDVVRKASAVPGVEAGESGEGASVFDAEDATLALLLCYDSVIHGNVARAVESGAEILLAPSDNASFSATPLSAWQIGASLVLAVEHGRPLVIVMNRGPTMLVDPIAGAVQSLAPSGVSAAAVAAVPRARGETLASRGGTLASVLGALVLGAVLLRAAAAEHPTRRARFGKAEAKRVLGELLLLAATACLALAIGGLVRVVGAAAVERDLPLGDGRDPDPEMLSAAARSGRDFEQSTPNGCGPAALAWVLFSLGDSVFEERVRVGAHRHSLAELLDLATQRGFIARAFQARSADLSHARQTGYVLHAEGEHFLGAFVREDGRIAVFDPADGSVRVLTQEQLAGSWSGYGLEIVLPRVASGF